MKTLLLKLIIPLNTPEKIELPTLCLLKSVCYKGGTIKKSCRLILKKDQPLK